MKTLVETSLFNLFASYTNGAGPAAGELPAAYNDFVNCLATLSPAWELLLSPMPMRNGLNSKSNIWVKDMPIRNRIYIVR